MKSRWDIYSQQPILLHHPSLPDDPRGIFVAGVCKAKKGIIWWAADYFIAVARTGHSGSGFAENPIPIRPKYIKEENCWIINDKGDRLYKFCLPSREMLRYYEENKQYVPSLEKLEKFGNDILNSISNDFSYLYH